KEDYDLFIAVGINDNRESIVLDCEKQGFNIVTLIDPTAIVSKYCSIDFGTVVMPNVVINANAKVCRGCIINTSSVIEHDCEIGEFTHISPSVTVAGTVSIGSKCWIGMGSNVLQNIRICNDVIVGA